MGSELFWRCGMQKTVTVKADVAELFQVVRIVNIIWNWYPLTVLLEEMPS